MGKKYICGLTGMSGAGKSSVCEQFKAAGFFVIDCDRVSRQAVQKGGDCLFEIEKYFGSEIITESGELDRKKLGNIVFSDKRKLERLNDIIYPYITYNVLEQIRTADNAMLLLDAPTLFESGIDFICDGIVSVVCDKETSIQRIMKRDKLTYIQAENRLSSQHPPEYYTEKSDYSIENNGSMEQLFQKTQTVINNLCEKIQ